MRSSASLSLLFFLLVFGWGRSAFADAPRPAFSITYTDAAPAVTAALGDAAWGHAATIDSLGLMLGPQAKGLVPLSTKVLAKWDDEYLYIRFVCTGGDLYNPSSGHDAPLFHGDVVEVFLDPVGDSREFVELDVSPDNSVLDEIHFLTAEPQSDEHGGLLFDVIKRDTWDFPSWDMAGLKTATSRLGPTDKPTGWIADFAIPAAELLRRNGLKQFEPMTLRANFARYDMVPNGTQPRTFIAMSWTPVEWGRPHRSPQAMGELRLVK